nr:uncharacterized protein LOC109193148 isoform X1 [Ipomoea batatas]
MCAPCTFPFTTASSDEVHCLGGDRSLALEEQDVEIVLGFRRGHIDMVKRDRLDVSNLLKKWRGKFEKTRHMVTPPEISTVMVGRVDGGLWFRRHLCMLVLSTLVSCMCNDYANQMYFHHFDNVARLRDLNWCKLVVDSLVETQVAWKSGAHKVFVGPAEFVALLVGVKQQPSSLARDGVQPSQPTFSQREDMLWSNPENLRATEDIERAIYERNELMDVPSFSLGLTQDFNDVVRGVVDDIARDYGSADYVRTECINLGVEHGNGDGSVDGEVGSVVGCPGVSVIEPNAEVVVPGLSADVNPGDLNLVTPLELLYMCLGFGSSSFLRCVGGV